jgi:hypothetical protein
MFHSCPLQYFFASFYLIIFMYGTLYPPSYSFILWRIIHDRMPTEDKPRERGCSIVSVCLLCLGAYETTTNLFFTCPFASALWAWLGNLLRCQLDFSSPVSLLLRCLEGLHANVRHIALSATIHTFHTI